MVFDYSYDGVMRSYEQALQRLGIPTVDGLAIHDLDRGFHGDDIDRHAKALLDSGVNALAELRRSGDIQAVGMGFNTSEAMDAFIGKVDLDYALVAHPYTLLEQTSLRSGMARCLEHNVSVIVGAPFASGILATGAGPRATYAYSLAPPAIQEKVLAIEASMRRAQGEPAGGGVAVSARPSFGCVCRCRSRARDRSLRECGPHAGAYPCRFLGGPKVAGTD